MTLQPEQSQPTPNKTELWLPDMTHAFVSLCQNDGLNPVRFRKLVDCYTETKRKPSRQQLIDAMKHRPSIKNRAALLSVITTNLNDFIDTFIDRAKQ